MTWFAVPPEWRVGPELAAAFKAAQGNRFGKFMIAAGLGYGLGTGACARRWRQAEVPFDVLVLLAVGIYQVRYLFPG